MGKGGYDSKTLAYELSSKIGNGFLLNLAPNSLTTNTTSYTRVGGGIVDMAMFRKSKITQIDFMAASGAIGNSGLDVQIYDVTNAAEIGLINFLGTDDNTIKSVDINTYLQTITGKIEVEVNVRKAGAQGPSTFNTAGLIFQGVK